MPSPSILQGSTPEAPVSDSIALKRPAVLDNESPGAENRRKDPKISRACDACKRKKVRCNGTLPCRNCDRRRLGCTYNSKYGRGRPPTPPISAAASQEPINIAPHISAPHIQIQHRDEIVEISGAQLPSRASPEAEIDGQYFDPTSGLNFLHRAWTKLFTRKAELASYGPNDSDRYQLLTSAGDRPFYVDQNMPENGCLPDDETIRKLQAFYFETCVVTYRMFHRPTVENWTESFLKDREQNRPMVHSIGPARTAILLTILAISSLRHEKIAGDIHVENEANALRRSDQLFCTAMKLTDSELGFPRLESAQARLLQVLYLLQTSRMNKGWYTFGNAFHITLSLGMHRRRDTKRDVPLSSRPFNYITSQCSKRTFWVAYIIDRYLSVVFGRPRLYQEEDIDQEFPESVNDEDMTPQGPLTPEEGNDCHIESLMFHARIATIIGRISRHVYSVSGTPKSDRLAAANDLVRELHEWRASLPSHLGTVQPSTLIPSFRRQAIALKLAYFHAIMHATRPFLLGEEATSSVFECIDAAKASLELVDKMARDNTLFHSFWWTHYVTFCALAVVYVWEIQQTRLQINHHNQQSYRKLFDLAERCSSHLQRATTGLSPSRRYNIILEELRLEAQECRVSRDMTQETSQDMISPFENSASLNNRFSELAAPGPGVGFQDANILNASDTSLFTDWLTLDSSVVVGVRDRHCSHTPEKDVTAMHLENQTFRGISTEDEEFLQSFSEEAKKRVLRKVDIRLVPMFVLLYLVAYIDKTNIGNAKIEGLLPSLQMDGIQYNIALSIFFIPYVLAEVPSNMILNRLQRPSRYLGGLIFCWGVIMTCTGFVQNFAGLVVIRFLLGLFEAGFLPGAVLIISKWYVPSEMQTRIGILYTSAASGGAFSGLLAFGIAKMDGIGNYAGWRWIFIIEGLATIVMAAACYMLLLDSPSLSSSWLTPDEVRFLEVRQLANTSLDSPHKGFDWRLLWDVFTDWKICLLIFANWSNSVPNYALKFTMPDIITTMGYTSAKAQLMTIPPYAVGAISAYAFSVFADRYTWRMPFILVPQLAIIVAFSILFSKSTNIQDNVALCYFGVCLACFGMYPILPGVNAWNVSNIPNPRKRAVAIGYLICMGNAGGIIGSYIYRAEEKPKYPTGYGTSFAFAAAGVVAGLTLEYFLWRENAKKEKVTEVEICARYTEDELREMGERSPLFKYTL
ncbi:hypothetical protein N7492_000995 [Penicillium capsulatum]|uniref:Major facilitator superfamily (MFS) profile domain-containing protein n=1 Tax=Penicillium capsulatum TaxID=69766 RepID=A0A9W9ISV6_9EURO|nr:hypothetical protein N7492_000995 [Penicillium capsulatum]KAJ6129945.1 hypothetical protein N7512_002725 [Penicillium capsulatum]